MKDKVKDIASFLLRFGISVILLWLIARQIDFEKTKSALLAADISFLVLGFFVFLSIYFILFLRWHIFVKALDLKVSTGQMARYFAIGLFGNLCLPSSIGGDAIKIYGLCKETTEKPKVVASVLLDRLSGYGGLVVTGSVAFAFGYRVINNPLILLAIIGLAVIWVSVMAILLNERLYSFFCQALNRFPKIKESVMQMHYDIALLHHKRFALWQTVGLSCCAQILYASVFFILIKALHVNMTMLYCLIFVPLVSVASAFPSIGGLGVREYAVKVLFGTVGVDSGIAVSASLINFFFMVIVGLLGGIVYVRTLSSGRLQYHQSDAGIESKEAGRQA